jgi:hypothetical protein
MRDQKAQSSGYSNSNSGQAHNLANEPAGHRPAAVM